VLIPERKIAPNLEVIWIEHHITWFCAYNVAMSLHSSSHHSCTSINHHVIFGCIHEIHWMHIHAIGVPRIVLRAKSHWVWNPKLKSVREPEVQSDEAGEDVGTILEAEPWSLFFWLRQAPEHYKPPTFKAIIFIYMLYVLLHYVIGVGWKPLLHW
jgi:hypothetical protein